MPEIAVLGGGCFWCLEAIFVDLLGVTKVTSGYAGGSVQHPTYEQVCGGKTGHAEVVQIEFDPEVIRYEQLLQVFMELHDPTSLNRQGNDVGTEYRSVIFYSSQTQQAIAMNLLQQLEKSGQLAAPIVTELQPMQEFYPAEDYHQGYFGVNAGKPYCQLVIAPKVNKVRSQFAELFRG